MANMILTPVTLWKDFDATLPLNEETISEREEDGIVFRDVYFYGRQTEKGRVKIYAQYVFPAGEEEFPAVMILFEAGMVADMKFVRRFLKRGYGVLCVDYSGENGAEHYTRYPADIDYANYVRAGRAMDYAEPTARETSWYEWAGVARYAARYLAERPEVTSAGAIGLRAGGEILFKIAPYAPIACMISVCAGGWLAYRGIDKFTVDRQRIFDEERHRFIAGIDSQSYAPYVKCPVLFVTAINDKKYNYDRVYDTFQQINPKVEKAMLFSSYGNGLVGRHSQGDINLFLDKFLKKRTVYLSAPITCSVEESKDGKLYVQANFDPAGEIEECGYFFTEKVDDFRARDWTRVLASNEHIFENSAQIPLIPYEGTQRLLLYTFVRYSNDFSVTSKIIEFNFSKKYASTAPKSRVIYSSADGLNGFIAYRNRTQAVADCFVPMEEGDALELAAGYGGITGITSAGGLISYRVGDQRYSAPEGASLGFHAFCEEDAHIKVVFFCDGEEKTGYYADVDVQGGGTWKRIILKNTDFKTDTGVPLADFSDAVSVLFLAHKGVLINQVIWL